jgi:Tfp pilus assembly protein PilV
LNNDLQILKQTGQSLMELVVGIGLVTIVAGALAIVTVNSLNNTRHSKNQVQATKLAQENLEKVRTIKNNNYGVCLQNNTGGICSTWEDIWPIQFGKIATTCTTGCTFRIVNSCNTAGAGGMPLCLEYINPAPASRADLGNGFTGVILIEDEGPSQKRVTSRVFWSGASGESSSDLATIMTRI